VVYTVRHPANKEFQVKIIPRDDLTSSNPVLAVRWCLEPGEAQQLKECKAKNISVLFVIAYEGGLEDRMLVPVEDMMAWLNFRRPGKHEVFATVLWGGKLSTIEALCLARSDRWRYEQSVLDRKRRRIEKSYAFHENEIGMLRTGDGEYPNMAKLEVMVPAEHFPKEPPKWIAGLANFHFECPPVDQCAFRRRCMVAPLRLPWFVFWAIITTIIRVVIALALVLHGAREIDFGAIAHPWRDDIQYVGDGTDPRNSWFLCDKDGRRRSRWWLLLYPYLYAAFFVLVAVVKAHNHLTWLTALDWTVWAFVLAALAIYRWFLRAWPYLLCIAIVPGIIYIVLRTLGAWAKKAEAAKLAPIDQTLLELREQERDKEYDDLAQLLACNALPFEVDIRALPPEHRTVKLYFWRLKERVCRPYAAR